MNDIDKIIEISQSPIGRTPRSNPATYTGLFTPLRELFAGTQEAIDNYVAFLKPRVLSPNIVIFLGGCAPRPRFSSLNLPQSQNSVSEILLKMPTL